MPILNKQDENEIKRYEEFLKEQKKVNLMQSLNWAKVKSDWENEVVYLENEGKIVAGMSILLKKIPRLNSYLAYSSRGPVCDFNNIDVVKSLVKEAELLKEKYNIFVLKMDPEVIEDKELIKLYKDNGFIVRGENSDVESLIQPVHNMILSLDGEDEESLFKRFSEKTRYNIRLASKKGVKVRYSQSKEDLKVFYELYKVTCIRDKIGCRAYSYFENMLESFKDYIRIYVASYEEESLSAAICINYGSKAFYIYGASSNEKRNLMPNYIMQWEMIKWAIDTNCDNYDFGGVLNLSKDDGLFRFKSGFCKKEGVTLLIGEVDKVYKKGVYFLYAKVLPIIKNIKKFFKRIARNINKNRKV